MKSSNGLQLSFFLNLSFSLLECVGGMATGSVAILSDAIHDLGDAIGIGISCYLERKSQKEPDERYTYGYIGYSVLGGILSASLLLLGSLAVIHRAVPRLLAAQPVHSSGMIGLAVLGLLVNAFAAWFTHGGTSFNLRAVHWHMLEDVLGWGIVLISAIVIKITNWVWIDPLLSIGLAIYMAIHAIKHLYEATEWILAKVPKGLSLSQVTSDIQDIDGVKEVHHVHIWSIDGQRRYATLHVHTYGNAHDTKHHVRQALLTHGIDHATVEWETDSDACHEPCCHIATTTNLHEHHRR